MYIGTLKGTVMDTAKNGNTCKQRDTTDLAKPTTTFSGRTDVDAAELVKTPRAKKVIDQLRRAKSAILSPRQC